MSDSMAEGPQAARESSEKSHRSGSGINGGRIAILLGILLLLIQPLIIIAAIIGIIAFEKRKVRRSRWLAAAAIIAALGIIAAGFNITAWASWIFARPSFLVFGDALAEKLYDTWPGLTDIRTHGIIAAATIAVPIGFLVTVAWATWRSYEISERGKMEGEAYSSRRPVGYVDRARIKRNTVQLRSGEWSRKNPGEIAIGIGKYGAVAHIPDVDFRATTVIIGTTRSGKTRTANSIADQIVHETAGGNITLDFKGDHEMVVRKAELARQMGVPFKHFELSNKHGAHYRRAHPYTPPAPAHYDPFSKGNGTSKAAMLLNSVPRDGDAAAYFRTANEAVKLAWDIATINGVNNRTHADGSAFSGLEVLTAMLDAETLLAEGQKVTAAAVKRANGSLSDTEAQRRAAAITNRIAMFEKQLAKSGSLLSAALSSVQSDVYGYINDSAAGNWLNIADVPVMQIDLIEAILGNEIILFTLPAQDYPEMSAMIGTLVLLDLGNAVTTLRDSRAFVSNGPAEWAVKGTDKTPWNPMCLQIEELGSIRSSAAATAMLGLLNKSADVEIRAVISSQSIADLDAVDGSGGWRRQVMTQVGNFMALTVPESSDGQMVSDHSGIVKKSMPTENRKAANNRFGFAIGASDVESVRSQVVDETRIPYGVPKELALGSMETLWINSRSKTPAVHTLGEEGPNQWYEVITGVPVHEPAEKWDPFDAPSEDIVAIETERNEVILGLRDRLARDPVLHTLTTNRAFEDPTAELDPALLDPRAAAPATTAGAPVTAQSDTLSASPAADQWGQLPVPGSTPHDPHEAPHDTGEVFDDAFAFPAGDNGSDVPLPEPPAEEPPFDQFGEEFPAPQHRPASSETERPGARRRPTGEVARPKTTPEDSRPAPAPSAFDDPFNIPTGSAPSPGPQQAPPAGAADPFGWDSSSAPAAQRPAAQPDANDTDTDTDTGW